MKTNKITFTRFSFLLLLSACSVGHLESRYPVVRVPAARIDEAHLLRTQEANQAIVGWYDKKSSDLRDWMKSRGDEKGMPDFLDFYLPEESFAVNPSPEDAQIALRTKKLYDDYFPKTDPSSYVGTFFESGHPYIQTSKGPYQWDSMEASGMENPEQFRKTIRALVKKGIKSVRLGPNLHEVGKTRESWKAFIGQLETIWLEGATPTISVAFFPSLAKWEVKRNGKIDYSRSYLLHKNWPADMGDLTAVMMKELWRKAHQVEKKLGRKVNVVINGVNEPETLAGFNRQFWHGAFANWGHPETMKYYIPSVIQIGKANVEIRLAVEANSDGRRILFMHNEAMTPNYYPSHKGPGRFAVSKFMLGHPDVMKVDYEALLRDSADQVKARLEQKSDATEVDWAIKTYIDLEKGKSTLAVETAKKHVLTLLQELKELHLKLKRVTGKSMKTDNMLHLDYYYQTEFIPNMTIDKLVEDLSKNAGQKIREYLGARDDDHFKRLLKRLVTVNEGDLKPRGPVMEFADEDTDEINFGELLTANDYIVLERLIGLRRDYGFEDREPFAGRQKLLGLRPLKDQLVRTDVILKDLTAEDNKLLKAALGVKTDEDLLREVLRAADETNTRVSKDSTVASILNSNKRAVLHHLLGIRRAFLLGFEPQHYPIQIKAGIRYGFYTFFMEYVNALGIYTAGVGESGTPFFYWAPLLHDQVMMEYARALKNGVYGTQYSFGPATDTRGWAKAPLGLHYDEDHEVNPSGILSTVPLEDPKDRAKKEAWADDFLKLFFKDLKIQK